MSWQFFFFFQGIQAGLSSSGSMCVTWSLSRGCHVSPLDTLHLEGGTFPALRVTHAENTVQGKSRRGLSPSSAPPQLAELGQTMAKKSFSLPILCHCGNEYSHSHTLSTDCELTVLGQTGDRKKNKAPSLPHRTSSLLQHVWDWAPVNARSEKWPTKKMSHGQIINKQLHATSCS